ncbi:hypothetical protein [Williamsia sterculiae]|uniref:Uncharacterized protein n=1 Tax=Williamsia sterculiae TaxID=1344003 RepID=A0A1N7GVA1_9NOCA|nr:hypothetical protein [Williamsia sterculiae]SIS16517.1 hypothetical protein SAMN05445060_3129 [Williamsia sterculiae]
MDMDHGGVRVELDPNAVRHRVAASVELRDALAGLMAEADAASASLRAACSDDQGGRGFVTALGGRDRAATESVRTSLHAAGRLTSGLEGASRSLSDADGTR